MEHKFYIAAFNHLTPFPGTPLYRRWEARGAAPVYEAWWLDERYRYNQIPFTPRHMAPETAAAGVRRGARSGSTPGAASGAAAWTR